MLAAGPMPGTWRRCCQRVASCLPSLCNDGYINNNAQHIEKHIFATANQTHLQCTLVGLLSKSHVAPRRYLRHALRAPV